jgi:hypothetical protein
MLFVFHCLDKRDHAAVRAENRQAHLDYLKGYTDRIFAVGPLLSEDTAQMVGSLLILDFETLADAQRFAAGDPYAKADLFDTVSIRPWRKVLPA